MPLYDGDKNKIVFDDEHNTVGVDNEAELDFVIVDDDAIIHFGMVNQDYLTELGCQLQSLYDEIIYQKHNQ